MELILGLEFIGFIGSFIIGITLATEGSFGGAAIAFTITWFFLRLLGRTNKQTDKTKRWTGNLDEMDGYEFEEFVAELYKEKGYNTRVTKKSGDQGVDVIAGNSYETLAIQTKNYQNRVSNSAVQEVVAGKNMVGADKAIVVANSNFTNSAKELAHANQVELVDKEELLEMIDEYF